LLLLFLIAQIVLFQIKTLVIYSVNIWSIPICSNYTEAIIKHCDHLLLQEILLVIRQVSIGVIILIFSIYLTDVNKALASIDPMLLIIRLPLVLSTVKSTSCSQHILLEKELCSLTFTVLLSLSSHKFIYHKWSKKTYDHLS
jgi:hypothetical protein